MNVLEDGFGMESCPMRLMRRFWIFVAGAVAVLAWRTIRYPLLSLVAALVGGWVAIQQSFDCRDSHPNVRQAVAWQSR